MIECAFQVSAVVVGTIIPYETGVSEAAGVVVVFDLAVGEMVVGAGRG
jgi:hypothetical protein